MGEENMNQYGGRGENIVELAEDVAQGRDVC